MAGKREGIKDQARVFDLCGTWAADPTVPKPTEGWNDERSPLAAEPMRWAATLRPELMAWEQVPPVLDLWSHCATLLGALGYSTWTGILSAERYGVPQTRKRAILLASRVGQVHPPHPTHQAYVAGEPARHDFTLEGEILPWVSMAEALGWTAFNPSNGRTRTDGGGPNREPNNPAPSVTGEIHGQWRVGFPRRADTPSNAAGESVVEIDGEEYRARDFRDQDEPAFVVTEKARSAIKLRANAQENAAERGADEPAPTIKGGNDSGDRVWTGCGDPLGLKGEDWPERRPATVLAGDPRVFQPGGHHGEGEQSQNAVRVTIEEASVLQSFPPDYPWQGSRSAQFRQIGNAVPPALARAILAALAEGHDVGSDCIDLFAGPGGWDVGAQALGIDPLGIEFDDNACATREAAGLRTLQGDVSALDPREVAAPVEEAA